ncbi:MAG: hypothetical protein KatS3mg103_1219 [Phycisphaerales bacterium]|nr:MAG: hypothetical protein KatS3mg103_1219 [Phycisphaerales bacterium]
MARWVAGACAVVLVGTWAGLGWCLDSRQPHEGMGRKGQHPAVELARGVVFEDANGDGVRQAGEAGLEGVAVSNGRDVVLTDAAGRYEVPAIEGKAIFVIKPAGYAVPTDEHNLPRFFFNHEPAGSPIGLRYAGLAPTGALPESIDFALRPIDEPEAFGVLLLGDPQPRDQAELGYFVHDVLDDVRNSELGRRARLAIALGDVMFDDLSLLQPYIEAMSVLGVPVHNVHGNHDMNFDVPDDRHADATWRRLFGPGTYAFTVGRAHFIVLDDVVYEGDKRYRGDLDDDQLAFVRNVLALVPRDDLIVLAMHIPLPSVQRRAELLEILSPFENTLSVAAHWHRQALFELGSEDGWRGSRPHRHLVQATASGSWWAGVPDERGIPHATMSDGQPNGWSMLLIDGNRYAVRFKAAGRPEHEQMAIDLPAVVPAGELAQAMLRVNAWASGPGSTVQFRVDDGPWQPMAHAPQHDRAYLAMKAMEEQFPGLPGRTLPDPSIAQTIWQASMPAELSPGVHDVQVRHIDPYGQAWTARRTLWVR